MADRAPEGTPAASAVPALHLRLPGVWQRIDLRTEAASRRDCDRLLEAGGSAGAPESHRQRLSEGLLGAATRLRATGASTLAIATRLGPSTPLPCSLIIGEPLEPISDAAQASTPAALLDAIERALGAVDAEGAACRRVAVAGSAALRRHRVIGGAGETGSARRLHVEYWLPIPGTRRFLPIVFGTPLAAIPGIMLGFFDAIVGAVRFTSPRDDPDARAG